MATTPINVLVIENTLAHELLIREILLQLDSRLSIRGLHDAKAFGRYFSGKGRTLPDTILIGHHLPHQNAGPILLMMRNDPRFAQCTIYVVCQYPPYSPSYWRDQGADNHILWYEKPSAMKTALAHIFPKKMNDPDLV